MSAACRADRGNPGADQSIANEAAGRVHQHHHRSEPGQGRCLAQLRSCARPRPCKLDIPNDQAGPARGYHPSAGRAVPPQVRQDRGWLPDPRHCDARDRQGRALAGQFPWPAVRGFSGTTQVANKAPGAVAAAPIQVRFDANVAANMPWRFTPPDLVEVRLGEQREVAFTAVNLSKEPILGTATFNVAPFETGKYFNKIQCFCFTKQLLLPGERKWFSVLFFVDP